MARFRTPVCRKVAVAFGLVLALSVLIVRPVCDAFAFAGPSSPAPAATVADSHGHDRGHDVDACCDRIEAHRALIASSAVSIAGGGFEGAPGAIAETAWTWRSVTPSALARGLAPPGRSLPYHARSSRILV